MARSHQEYCFHEGRKQKSNRKGPGILIVEEKYKFCINQVNKAGDIFKMYCNKHTYPEFKCKAKAVVDKLSGYGSLTGLRSIKAIGYTKSINLINWLSPNILPILWFDG